MLTPPADLSVEDIAAAAGVHAAAMTYRPVGWGSHHWSAGDWFVTVDDLHRLGLDSLDAAFDRLSAALAAPRGLACAIAPDGPIARLGTYAVARYPFVTGESFGFGLHEPGEQRDAVLEMLAEVHRADRPDVPRDDFSIALRDGLEAALDGAVVAGVGPYESVALGLIRDNAGAIRRVLGRYDALAARADPARSVLTHGEPHRGNMMRTPAGWRLIDWDTALLAPPERDLWLVGGELRAYAKQTGTEIRPELLQMYALRWDLADLAVDLDRFRRPHRGTAEDDAALAILRQVVAGLPT